jgi:hypothetical protein
MTRQAGSLPLINQLLARRSCRTDGFGRASLTWEALLSGNSDLPNEFLSAPEEQPATEKSPATNDDTGKGDNDDDNDTR